MVRTVGWRATFGIWAVTALIMALALGGSLLIGYGVERL